MTASIEVGPDNDLPAIAAAAGQSDVDMRYYENGRLYVLGVAQADLDAALVAYDESAYQYAQHVRHVQAEADDRRRVADNAISPLQDAVDLEDATLDEVALLRAWKQYRVALNRIPTQAGYPAEILWPNTPA